jgi:hypothetical protein
MPKWERGNARHVLMRAGLGFVLAWFGVQELRNPTDWAVFVPTIVADHSPVAINDLILLHGFLLLLAAAAIVLGILYVLGCLLAVGLVVDIILGLWLDGGVSDLVIRDIGLLALTGAVAIDPVRFWHLDNALPRLLSRRQPVPPPKGVKTPKGIKAPPPQPPPSGWQPRAGAGAALLVAVLLLSFVLHATGSNGAILTGSEVNSLDTSSAAPTPHPADAATPGPTTALGPVPAGATATPVPSAASTVRFDGWKYKQYAFQVFPGQVSADAKTALAGFDLSIQDKSDGTVLLNLKALSSRYRDAAFTVDKKNAAYFVETSMRDDPNNAENNLNDDGLIVVSPDGYILKS